MSVYYVLLKIQTCDIYTNHSGKSGENVQNRAKKSGKTWKNQGILSRKRSGHPANTQDLTESRPSSPETILILSKKWFDGRNKSVEDHFVIYFSSNWH